MKKYKYQVLRDLPHFTVLLGIFLLAIIGFFVFSYDRGFQTAIVVGAGISYFVWGVVHHFIHHSLNIGIVLEYFVFAAVGLLIVLSVI